MNSRPIRITISMNERGEPCRVQRDFSGALDYPRGLGYSSETLPETIEWEDSNGTAWRVTVNATLKEK